LRNLDDIIADSYRIFATYKIDGSLDICTHCCMPKENERLLARLPVKEIPRDLLSEYNDGAWSMNTEAPEFKHFLPRYFDLIRQMDFPSHSAEIALYRLKPFDKSEWTTEELDNINAFAKAFFAHCLTIYPLPDFLKLDAILIMFWKGQFEVQPLLDIWARTKTDESIAHFRDLIFYMFKDSRRPVLDNPFGEDQDALAELMYEWQSQAHVKANFMEAIETLIMNNQETKRLSLWDLDVLYDMVMYS